VNHLPDPNFSINSKVWLLRKFIKTNRPNSKLDHIKLGPFTVLEKIGRYSYKLQLPTTMKIYPVFHMSLLKSVSTDNFPNHIQEPPYLITIEDYKEYKVNEILDYRKRYNKLEYLIN